MGKIVGSVVREDHDGVVLSWPAFLSIRSEPVPGTTQLQYKARFEPIAFVSDRYLLYRTAIRGECYWYGAAMVEAYAKYAEAAAQGKFELTEVTYESTKEEAPGVSAEAAAPATTDGS